jgi:hypothetical protein
MKDPQSVKTTAAAPPTPPPSTTTPSPKSSDNAAAPEDDDDAPTIIDTDQEDAQVVGRLSIKELRTELAHNNVRWAGLLEKSDLVQAVVEVRKAALAFSVTGKLRPGTVTTLVEEDVRTELFKATESHVPLLLDIFAV